MSIVLLGGYAIAIINISFLATSECVDTTYGKILATNIVILFVVGSYMFAFAHIILFLPTIVSWTCWSKIKNISCKRKLKGEIVPQ